MAVAARTAMAARQAALEERAAAEQADIALPAQAAAELPRADTRAEAAWQAARAVRMRAALICFNKQAISSRRRASVMRRPTHCSARAR